MILICLKKNINMKKRSKPTNIKRKGSILTNIKRKVMKTELTKTKNGSAPAFLSATLARGLPDEHSRETITISGCYAIIKKSLKIKGEGENVIVF